MVNRYIENLEIKPLLSSKLENELKKHLREMDKLYFELAKIDFSKMIRQPR